MKKNTKKKMNNKGFSLVELIVVIAIMAILVGVLAPTVMKQIEKSRYSKDIQALDGVYTATRIVATDETAWNKIKKDTHYTSTKGFDGTYQDLLDVSESAGDDYVEKLLSETFDVAILNKMSSSAFAKLGASQIQVTISQDASTVVVHIPSAENSDAVGYASDGDTIDGDNARKPYVKPEN